MSFRLVPLIKEAAPVIPLQRPVLLIGRHPDCDVRLNGSKISRRHCCVAMAYDRLLIRDLGSRNGVRHNGRVIEETQLECGDEVAIGPIIFRLELLEDEPAVARRPAPSALTAGSPPRTTAPPPRQRALEKDWANDLVPLDD